jgi:hydrogenase 3 maturation protease
MQKLIQELKNRLKPAKAIALLGVGSELRGDDAAGIMVAGQLEKACRGNKRLKVFIGHTAPENLTGEIKRFNPTHLVIVDCADLGKKAGDAALIDIDNMAGVSFCTHQLPVKVMADYLWQSIQCQIIIVGIQPKQLKFASKASKEIMKSARQLTKALKEIVNV